MSRGGATDQRGSRGASFRAGPSLQPPCPVNLDGQIGTGILGDFRAPSPHGLCHRRTPWTWPGALPICGLYQSSPNQASGGGHGSFPGPIPVQPDRGGMQRDSLLPFPHGSNDPQRLGLEAGPAQEVPSADGEVVVVPCVQDGRKARHARVPFQQGL